MKLSTKNIFNRGSIESSLHRLFIYNSKFEGKTEETEHEKILYFYPNDINLGEQQKRVGLSEALIQFTKDFSPKKPCDYMFNKKQKHVFLEVEPGYWMIMIINRFDEQKEESSNKNSHEFLNNLMLTSYEEFKMFYSPMDKIVEKSNVDQLKITLKEFFDEKVNHLKLRIEKMEVTDIFNGLSFIPVDSAVFLLIQSFFNQIFDKFEIVKSGIFYFENFVIFSLMKHENVKTCEVLFKDAKVDSNGFHQLDKKKIYFDDEFYYPIIYSGVKKMKILLLLDEEKDVSIELKSFLDEELMQINDVLPDNLNLTQNYDELYRYVYFNRMNLAFKSSLTNPNQKIINQDTLELISEIRNMFNMNSKDGLKEVYIRTRKDFWIVANFFAEREFYHYFENKHNSLVEINEHFRKAKRLFTTKQNEDELEKVYVSKPNIPYVYTPDYMVLRVIVLLLSGFAQTLTMLHVLLFGFIFAPIRLFHTGLYQKCESMVWCHASKMHLFMTNFFVGIPTYIYGDYEGGISEGKKIVLSNHCSSADWLIQLSTAARNTQYQLLDGPVNSMVIKKEINNFSKDMIFLTRDIKVDKPYMKEKLTGFMKNNTDNMLVLYPEGTFATSDNEWLIEKSHKWSIDHNEKKLNYVLFPRTQGFSLVMETREAFDYVVDLTIAFEKPYCGKLAEFDPPTLKEFFYPLSKGEEQPVRIHTYYKKYKISDIPKDTDKWLVKLFEEKDELLEYFDEHQRFPGKRYQFQDSFWDYLMNFIVGWAVYIGIGYLIVNYIPYGPMLYFGTLIFVGFSGLYILYYDLKHQWKHVRASKVEKPTEKKN
eukprot:gene8968-917_t